MDLIVELKSETVALKCLIFKMNPSIFYSLSLCVTLSLQIQYKCMGYYVSSLWKMKNSGSLKLCPIHHRKVFIK